MIETNELKMSILATAHKFAGQYMNSSETFLHHQLCRGTGGGARALKPAERIIVKDGVANETIRTLVSFCAPPDGDLLSAPVRWRALDMLIAEWCATRKETGFDWHELDEMVDDDVMSLMKNEDVIQKATALSCHFARNFLDQLTARAQTNVAALGAALDDHQITTGAPSDAPTPRSRGPR